MITNLPPKENLPDQAVKQFYNSYFNSTVSYPSNVIDAVVGFFTENGFDKTSASSVAIVILNQANAESVNPMAVIDNLRKLSKLQLGQIVAQIINANRENTSLLGYRITNNFVTYESRNIIA